MTILLNEWKTRLYTLSLISLRNCQRVLPEPSGDFAMPAFNTCNLGRRGGGRFALQVGAGPWADKTIEPETKPGRRQ